MNEFRVNLIKEVLTRMKKSLKNVPKNKVFKIEENEEIKDAAERILELNNKIQSGQGLKY